MSIIETTPEWRADEGLRITQQVKADISNRQDWQAQRLEARSLYYGETARPDIHWEGATDIHLPLVYDHIERLVPKMNNSFWNVWPHVIVDRVPSEYDPTESRIQEHFMNWAIDYDIPGFYMTTHQWFRNAMLDGVSQVKTQWISSWRRTCEIHRLKQMKRSEDQPQNPEPGEPPQMEFKSAFDLLDELFGKNQWHPAGDLEGDTIYLTIVEDRRPIEGVKVVFRGESQFMDELDILVYRPILVEDNPNVDVIESDNLVLPARTRNIQKAKRVTHIHYMDLEELAHESNEKRFDPWHITPEDWVMLEAESRGTEYEEQDSNNQSVQKLKDDVEGMRETVDPRDMNPVMIYEVYKKVDLDGDGMMEEIVLQVAPRINKVLHVTYLDTVHPHGRRPFASIHFNASTDRYYTPGLAVRLAPLNMQANITLNQVNDRQTLINNPIYFYRPMSLPQDPDALLHLKPGDGVASPDPSGIVFPQWGSAPLQDMTIMGQVLSFADRIGAPALIGGDNSGSTPRTARAHLASLSEANISVDTLISLAQKEGFQELMQQLFGLYSVNMSDEKHFFATGRDRVKRPEMISRRLMRGRYEFRFRGNTVNTNPEVQRTLSQIRYQVASTNPLYQQDPRKFRELLRDFLEAHSDGTSVERILPDLPGAGAEPHPPMSQKDEITAMRMHRPIQVLDTDNHLQHLAELDTLEQSHIFEQLDEVALTMLAGHYGGHVQAMQRQQQESRIQAENSGQGGGGAGGNDGGGGAGGPEQGIGLSELGI